MSLFTLILFTIRIFISLSSNIKLIKSYSMRLLWKRSENSSIKQFHGTKKKRQQGYVIYFNVYFQWKTSWKHRITKIGWGKARLEPRPPGFSTSILTATSPRSSVILVSIFMITVTWHNLRNRLSFMAHLNIISYI